MLVGLLWAWAAVALGQGVGSVVVRAQVSEDLGRVQVTVSARVRAEGGAVQLILPAERYRLPPDPLPPHAESELYSHGVVAGGFERLVAQVEGSPCQGPRAVRFDGTAVWACEAAASTVSTFASAELVVPERHGPFSKRGRQLTLGGGWFPVFQPSEQSAPASDYDVEVQVPAGAGVVLGDRWFAPIPTPGVRTVRWRGRARQVPLVVLPPWAGSRSVAQGRARFIAADLRGAPGQGDRLRFSQVSRAVDESLSFLVAAGLPAPTPSHPLLVVQAPLRHELARVTDGVVLVSDHAFRLVPLERFLRFHRYPMVRAVMTTWLLRGRRGPEAVFDADAAGAYLRDAFVRDQAGQAEDAFDVLSLWSFIPAVDSLLYAPQLPFVGAYFRLIQEEDPLSANLLDPPSARPRGKLAYEKLLDAFGEAVIAPVFRQVAAGARLESAVAQHLGGPGLAVLHTWSQGHPKVQYRLLDWSDREVRGARCAPAALCYEAQVRFERLGDEVAEPVTLLLEDEEGEGVRRVAPLDAAPIRTLTATLAAPLNSVVLDPDGRLAETPSADIPSPRFDNRSHPRWRVLLNSFNVLYSPSANNLDTALDLGFSRVRDVHWRFAARASYAPDTVSLSARSTYRFGRPVTPDSLVQWVGVVLGGEYLRPEFAGTRSSAMALSGTLYYGYDDRRTAWAPEAGTGFRASLGFSQVFGDLADDSELTRGAVNLTLRGLRSWRIDARHQLSLRASFGAYLFGTPRVQLRYALGGRSNLRGYVVDDEVGRIRGLLSGEWVHHLVPDMDLNAAWLVWVRGLDGALFADVGVIGDDLAETFTRTPRADLGYGLRIYIDYFGVRPGVMAIDLALPLVDDQGRFAVGPPAVYIDFAQSFFAF